MIISADHKGLEWVTAVYLSQDQVGIEEIWNGVDQHGDNQKRFGLPSRFIAKVFVFRLIYGGSAYSYAHDPEFRTVGLDVNGWQKVIDAFYEKYSGLAQWHKDLLDSVGRTGKYTSPSGREYFFNAYQANGEWRLPRTKILNYPVQGFGSEIVLVSRIMLAERMELFSGTPKYQTKLINTVHDDIWLDIYPPELEEFKEVIIPEVFAELPDRIGSEFGIDFNLPTKFEIKDLTGNPV